MYLRKVKDKKGRVFLSIAQNYHVPGVGSKSRKVQSIGYADKYSSEYQDPIAHFEEVVRKMNAEASSKAMPETYEFDRQKKLAANSAERNIGYAALSAIYHELGLDVFLNNRQRGLKIKYSLNGITRLLVYARILRPGSKSKAHKERGWFFDRHDFSLDDVYRSLGHLREMKDAIQVWMHENIIAGSGRDASFVYYDVTNYYFEIDEEDEMRKKGVCKEHRPDPIIQMGLFIDNDGIPISYNTAPGNNNDCTMLVPHLAVVRQKYNVGKVVVVADKGMNTARNAYYIANGRGWYIFSQTVRGGADELKKYVLKENGYVWGGKDFKSKSRQFTRHVEIGQDNGGPPIHATISEKQVVFYSRDYDRKAKRDREKAVQKAKEIVASPSRFNKYNTYGAAKYIENLEYDVETGEIINTGSAIRFNGDRLREDEAYDGYYVVVSNCHDKPDDWIIDKYRGLWEIEETFRISKSELETRPVYLSRLDHIEAHFLTCFISLTIIRILQKRLNRKYSTERLIESLSRACCANVEENKYMAYYYDEVLEDVGEILNIDFSRQYLTMLDIRKLIGDTKKNR